MTNIESYSNNEIETMNSYSLYIEIVYNNRWQNIVNILKEFMMKYLMSTCYPLRIFKLLIVYVLLLLPILYPYIFPTFTYDSSCTWCRNSVGYIIKFPTTFFNLLDGSVIRFYIFEENILIVVADLHLQRHTTFTYYNSMKCTPSTFVIFPRAITFSSFPLHNPSPPQLPLLKIWRAMGLLLLPSTCSMIVQWQLGYTMGNLINCGEKY